MIRAGASSSAFKAVLAAAACAALCAPPAGRDARAQEDPKEAARAKLVEGGELLKQGEYEQALARFKAAYDLVQSPKIFYNFGLAYMGLGRKVEAIESFEKFLDEANDASPDLRANAERHRSALAVQTGAVAVVSDVDGAEVSVDGRSYGQTPLRRPVRLNPGPHSLVVEKAGSPPFAQKLTVDAGQKVTVEVRLAPTVPDGGVMGAGGASGAFAPDGGFGRPGDTEVPGRGWKWKAAIGTGVAAALVLGFGLTEQILASGHYSDFNSAQGTYGPCDADSRVIENGGQPCPQLLADGDSASRLAVVGFIAGGVLAAGSATLFVLSHMEKRAAANASAGAGATNGVAAAAAGGGRSLLCVPSLAAQAGVSCQIRF